MAEPLTIRKLSPEAQERWKRVEELADRLGVKPMTMDKSGAVILRLPENGPTYELAELAWALLDRLDEASRGRLDA